MSAVKITWILVASGVFLATLTAVGNTYKAASFEERFSAVYAR